MSLMKRKFDHFPYGASYSPLVFPEEEWVKDLSNMRDNHMNLLRIGDVAGSWDQLEPQEGKYQFDTFNKFYRVADSYGIDILLSTGTSSPPLWLVKDNPDISLISNRGEKYSIGSSYHWACIHNPNYFEAAKKFVTHLISFAKSHPNHFGWQISNEVGFPFIPSREKDILSLYCYCGHCQQNFRDWVHEKYKTLANLNKAWAWSTSGFIHNDWSDVFAPESLPKSWASVTRWIDWRLFWQDAFATFIRWQHQLIKKMDPDHPTSVNTFNFKGFDRFGTFTGLDQWKIAKEVDHIGYDLYPGSGNKLKKRPEHNSMFLDHGKSVAASNGRDFWIHEVESGPIGGWVLGPDHNTNSKDIENYIIESLGHNAKLILFMPWREWDFQPLHWGALVDLDGNGTSRLLSAGKLGDFIRKNSSYLLDAKLPQSEVAIIESKANSIFFRGVGQEEILFDAQRGAYRAFWERGFSVDFLDTSILALDKLSVYRFVCLPLLGLMSKEHAEILEAYVRNGGILIGFSRCATSNEIGWFHRQIPIPGLESTFGLKHIEADVLDDPEILFNGKEYRGWMNRDIVEPLEGTEILATFKDGNPAITLAKHGKGFGVYLATQADSGYLQPEGRVLEDLIQYLGKHNSIYPQARFIEEISRTSLDFHLLRMDNRIMMLFSNYLNLDKETNYQFQIIFDRQPKKIKQIFPNPKDLMWESNHNFLNIPLQFMNKEVKIIELSY